VGGAAFAVSASPYYDGRQGVGFFDDGTDAVVGGSRVER
jgi:hypothetical protein